MRHEVPQLRKLPEDWPHLAGTAERQVGTASRSPRNVASELDDVAASLVGEQQQLAVRHRRAVPATHVVWRDAAGGSGQAQPPFVFAPPLGEFATEQQSRGACEMRRGQIRRERNCARRGIGHAGQVQHRAIGRRKFVVCHRLGWCQRHSALRGGQCLPCAAKPAIQAPGPTMVRRDIRRLCDRLLNGCQRRDQLCVASMISVMRQRGHSRQLSGPQRIGKVFPLAFRGLIKGCAARRLCRIGTSVTLSAAHRPDL